MPLWFLRNLSEKRKRKKQLKKLQKRLGVRFKNPRVLNLALTHISFVNGKKLMSYERLEFLGDAVLELAITDYLFNTFAKSGEGEMTSIRSDSVNENTLAKIAESINLESFILIDRNILENERARKTVLADTVEAIFGAIFIDRGYKKAKKVIINLLLPFINERIEKGSMDYKSTLQKISAKQFHNIPDYQVVEIKGPEHQREYTVEVVINGKKMGQGKGGSKKEAEQNAAKNALNKMKQ